MSAIDPGPSAATAHPSPERRRTRDLLTGSASVAALAVLWTLTHRYGGITQDAHIYAFQAFARIRPALHADIYLSNTSQDRFTIFSPIFALFIRTLGLKVAGELLLGVCLTGFLVAGWFAARALLGRELAVFSVALLILTAGVYGAYGIFTYAQDYLTARSPAEALVVTALALALTRRHRLAAGAVLIAMLLHPLMAFPGLLLLLALWTSPRWNAIGAIGGVAAAALISIGAIAAHVTSGPFAVLDPTWLDVVRERSQFLFLALWHAHDWDLNVRPFLTVALAVLTLGDDPRIRKLCIAATWVGASGLAVAAIASSLGPVAILLQGQAWRWDWVTTLAGVILLPGVFLRCWRAESVGPVCAIIAVLAWTFEPIDGTAALAGALLLWSLRGRLGRTLDAYFRWSAIAIVVLALIWGMGNSWMYLATNFNWNRGSLLVQRLSDILGLKVPALLLLLGLAQWLRRTRTLAMPAALTVAFAAALVVTVPFAFDSPAIPSLAPRPDPFSNWRRAIPPAANVFVDDGSDSPLFAWFTLRRPSYLSIDQSAGVVFSRKTALEIARRAKVLRPLMFPDYRVLDKRRAARLHQAARPKKPWPKPLTIPLLERVCRDPSLGFVIAHQHLGFDAISHTARDAWNGWSLYDCARVRARMRGA